MGSNDLGRDLALSACHQHVEKSRMLSRKIRKPKDHFRVSPQCLNVARANRAVGTDTQDAY